MSYQRASLLFAVTTAPTDRSVSSPHSGGWSESHWSQTSVNLLTSYLIPLAQKRAPLLPALASIIGWRIESFDIAGNKLLPSGASSGRFQFPGNTAMDLNLPQDALMISGAASGFQNTNRFALRCLPDSQTTFGEYSPDTAYKGYITQYLNRLIADVWGFVGRVKTNQAYRVNKIAAGVVTLNGSPGVVDNATFLRLNRVFDDTGRPVKGTFLVTAHAGNTFTLEGLGAVSVSKPSGTARVDEIKWFSYGNLAVNRAVVRKMGRPFEQYRGRSSSRTA